VKPRGKTPEARRVSRQWDFGEPSSVRNGKGGRESPYFLFDFIQNNKYRNIHMSKDPAMIAGTEKPGPKFVIPKDSAKGNNYVSFNPKYET
jgi:hypothetical protein